MINAEIIIRDYSYFISQERDHVILEKVIEFGKMSYNKDEILRNLLGFTLDEFSIRRHTVKDIDFNPHLFFIATINDTIVGMAMALQRVWKKGNTDGWVKFLYVLPEYRNKGVGGLLYQELEYGLRYDTIDYITLGSSSPLYLVPGLPFDWESSLEFLEKRGWKDSSIRTNLSITISNQFNPVEVYPPYYIVDVDGNSPNKKKLINFIRKEFSESWALEVEGIFQYADEFPNSFVQYISYKDYGIEGIIGFIAIGGTNPNWLGPMGVKNDYRGEGLGKKLLLSGMYKAQELGYTQIIIPWVNQDTQNFYKRVIGATIHSQFYKMELDLYNPDF